MVLSKSSFLTLCALVLFPSLALLSIKPSKVIQKSYKGNGQTEYLLVREMLATGQMRRGNLFDGY